MKAFIAQHKYVNSGERKRKIAKKRALKRNMKRLTPIDKD